jgi:hypothetical protein
MHNDIKCLPIWRQMFILLHYATQKEEEAFLNI